MELKKGWKEDGDLSLILKNVTTADGGTYKCEAYHGGQQHRKRAANYISTVRLSVVPAGECGSEKKLLSGFVCAADV